MHRTAVQIEEDCTTNINKMLKKRLNPTADKTFVLLWQVNPLQL